MRFFKQIGIWLGILLVWQWSAAAMAGSPFYLTAERSFSNTETPSIRLDYTVTNQPMLVRVLKPEQLDRYLDGQFNISRSYEQPISELNPGYYFAKGLNTVQSPLRLLRNQLSVDLRKSLKDTAFTHALVKVTDKPLVAEPDQVLIAPPAGFKTVNETFLDLQKNGKSPHDLNWWFGSNYYFSDQYKIRQIDLPPLPDGIYLVQAVQGNHEAQCLVQVSSLAVQVKQSSAQLLVRVMDRQLNPVAHAKVSYRDGRGLWQAIANETNAAGEVTFANPEGSLDGKLLVKVEALASQGGTGLRTALTATDFLPAQNKDNSVFVMTDRPIFKPGETFFYKGLIRNLENGDLKIPALPSLQTQVSLLQANGKATGLQSSNTLTEFGSFSGSFNLNAGQEPGLYQLLAQIGSKAYGGEFRVRDYVKPTYYLQWLEHSPSISLGQPFNLKFRAKRYSGGIPQDVKFEVFLYRKKFEAAQFVEDAGLGLNTGNDYFGSIKSTAPLSQPQRLFSSIQERQAAELANPWETAAKLDDNGEGSFEFTVPKNDTNAADQEWVYTVMVRAQDSSGSLAVLSENIYATLSEAQPVVRFNKTVSAVGEENVQLLLQANYSDGKAAANAGGTIDITLEQPDGGKKDLLKLAFSSDNQGRQQMALPALQNIGKLTAVAKLETLNGQALKYPAHSQPATLIVAGHGGEAVTDNRALELYTTRTVLSPGEQADIFALLPKAWGQQENGQVWQTTAGERIFDSQSRTLKGRSQWFAVTAKPEYGTGFYHTITVPMADGKYQEQTLGFRIVPREKLLQINIKPEKTEAEPLKPTRLTLAVKRADGSPAANTELALSIVDRAVYAVQAEFRPSVFDFFYPLQRSNVSTFYSDELQGYGYADLLRKPNFALSALKSQSKLAKKALRDTAGWFPHLLTDANGEVSVNVDMPANVTEWLVTAVANDKQGRLGETTGQFRTVTDVAVDVVSPQFMRIGDEAEWVIRLSNQLPEPVQVSGSVKLDKGLQKQSGEMTAQISLPAKGEQLWPLRVLASGPAATTSLSVSLNADAKIRVGGQEGFDIPLQNAALRQVFSSQQQKQSLSFQLPAQAQAQQLDVRVNEGLLGAALQAAAMLVQYPYGCTEQLAHSTVPNLVLLDLIQRAGIKPEQLGPLEVLLNRARDNAALGIRKLHGNQKADGGFSLWPNDSDTSVPVTLIALQALQYAVELQVDGAETAYSNGLQWLSNQMGRVDANDNFSLSAFTRINAWVAPVEQQTQRVSQVVADSNASAEQLITALRIISKYQGMDYHQFNQQFPDMSQTRQDLVARLQKALAKLSAKDWQATPNPQLGFSMGLPSVVSDGMAVLDEANALTPELATQLKKYLLDSQRNGYWGSTYDTAQVIFNIRNLLSKEAQASQKASRTLTVRTKNGASLGSLSAIPGGYLGHFENLPKTTELGVIKIAGLDDASYANASLALDVPYTTVINKADGIKVQRHYQRITTSGSEALDLSKPLQVGDLVVSQVHVARTDSSPNTHQQGSDYVIVEDGIPSLAEGMENDRNYLADAKVKAKQDSYWAAIKETQRYPGKIVHIGKLTERGELDFYQVWRVTRPGNAAIPPATAVDMYNESVQGNSVAERLSVNH
ncbi:hypothetical protein JCM14076_05900 [Methylosoma difficile]